MNVSPNIGSGNIDKIYAIISTQGEHIEGNKQITEKVSPKDIRMVDGLSIWMYYKPMDKLILFKLNVKSKWGRRSERVILAIKLTTVSNIVNIVKEIIEKSKYIDEVVENKLNLKLPKQLSINCYYVSDEYVDNPSIEYRCYIFENIYKRNKSKAIVFSKSKPDILNAIYIGPYCKKMSRNIATSPSTRGMSYDGSLNSLKPRVPKKKKTISIMGKEISIDSIDKILPTMMMAVVLIIGIAIGLFIHPYIFSSSSDNNKYGYLNNTLHNDILKLENVSNKVNNDYYLSKKNMNLSIDNTKRLSNIKNELNSIKNEINNLKTLLDNPQSNKTVIKTKIKKLENNINNIENNINNINNNEIKIKNISLIIFEDFHNLNMSLKSVKEDLININKKLNNKNPENKQWGIAESLNLNIFKYFVQGESTK